MERLSVAIVDVLGLTYDDTTVEQYGLGGSESAVIYMARELQALGFDVTVFNNCIDSRAKPGIYRGVTYRDLTELDHNKNAFAFDIMIASRSVKPFMADARFTRMQLEAKHKILWLHDTFCDGDQYIEDMVVRGYIDEIFTLSDWHTSYILNCDHGHRRNFEVLKRKTFQTRNGIKRHIDEVNIRAKDPNHFVYNASATKGMIPLVERVWPDIKKVIPDAHLTVIGGYYRFRDGASPDAQESTVQRLASDQRYKEIGVNFTGVIPQSEIALILANAAFTIYPGAFPETFGISTLESLAYNTPVITTRFGALEETAIEAASYLIDYAIEPNSLFPHINAREQENRFIATVIAAYNDKYRHAQKVQACNAVRSVEGWDTVALQWKQHIFKRLGAYLPVEEFRRVSRINADVHRIFGRRFANPSEWTPSYCSQERKIVVVSPFYNAGQYIAKCIESVAQQDYENYFHILIDDASTDNGYAIAKETIAKLDVVTRHKFTLLQNKENLGAVRNQISSIRFTQRSSSIVMLLDGDDSLVNDNTIFQFYNDLYLNGNAQFTYGSMRSLADNLDLIAQPYPKHVREAGNYRNYTFAWNMPYTHLRTFRNDLLCGVPDSVFQNEDGEWFRAGGDTSIFYTLIERAHPDAVIAVPRVVYNYNDLNPLNDYKVNAEEQNNTARKVLNS